MDHSDDEGSCSRNDDQRGHNQEEQDELPSFLVRAQQQGVMGRPHPKPPSGTRRNTNHSTGSPSSSVVSVHPWHSLDQVSLPPQQADVSAVLSSYDNSHDTPPGSQGGLTHTTRMATPLGRHDPSLSPIVSNHKKRASNYNEEEDDHSQQTGCQDVTLSSLRLEEEDSQHHHQPPITNHRNDSAQDSDDLDDEEEDTWMYRRAMQPTNKSHYTTTTATAKKSNRTVFEERVMEADETTSLLGHSNHATSSRGVWNRPWWKQKTTSSLDEPISTTKQKPSLNEAPKSRDVPSLKWSGGFFSSSASEVTSIYTTGGGGSHSNASNDKKHDAPNEYNHHHPTGHLFSSSETSQSELPSKSYFPTLSNGGPNNTLSLATIFLWLMRLHFFLMALHDLFFTYLSWRSRRRGNGNNNDDETNDIYGGPSLWLSRMGLVENPLIGPSAHTLSTFGYFNAARWWYKDNDINDGHNYYWTLVTSCVVSSSIPQLWANGSLLQSVAMPLELRMMDRFRQNHHGPNNHHNNNNTSGGGTIVVGALWCVSAGAAASMALWMGEDTGFASPIVMGCWGASLAESGVTVLSELLEGHPPPHYLDHSSNHHGRSQYRNYSYGRHSEEVDDCNGQRRRRHRGRRHGFGGRPCWTHLSTTMVQIILSLFPHSGIYALAGGFGAGLGFGLLLWSPLLRQDAHDDLEPPTLANTPDSNSNNNSHDNEATALFGSTPFPRSKFFTATTPLMRRPIHHSPDDEEQAPTKSNSPTTSSHHNSKSWHRNNSKSTTTNNNNNTYKTPACLASMVRLLGIGLIGLTVVLPVTLVGLGLGVNQNLSANDKSRVWKESLAGCRTVFRLFNDETTTSTSSTTATTTTCGEACVPMSLLGMAQRRFQMKRGYCDTFGFRCPLHTEQVTLVTGYNMSVDEYSYYTSYSTTTTNDDPSSQSGATCSTTQTNINNDDQQ